jgi:endonuclease-3
MSIERTESMTKAKRPQADPKRQARQVLAMLAQLYPDASCALVHQNPYELLVATILSAQCTDARVNLVTPGLFARYPDAFALAKANPEELEELIRPTGFFRAKAKNLLGMATQVVERHGGTIPDNLDALTSLPGVGRKTANVVLGTAFGIASGVVVDTHVKRLAYRLGLTTAKTPEQVERDLIRIVPRSDWVDLSHRLIQHGRRHCRAIRPRCFECPMESICPKFGVHPAGGQPARPVAETE